MTNEKKHATEPIILDEQTFRSFLNTHEGLRSKQEEIDRQKQIILNIKQRFNKELSSPDIATSLSGYEAGLANLESERKGLEEQSKPIEKKLRDILKEANGAPVIWRNIQGTTLHTFTVGLNNGNLELITKSESL